MFEIDRVLEAKKCINCAMCLVNCPTYKETFAENQSPRGRLAIFSSQPEVLPQSLKDCMQCGNCQASCPISLRFLSAIRTVEMLDESEVLETLEWLMDVDEVLTKDVFNFIAAIEDFRDRSLKIDKLARKVDNRFHNHVSESKIDVKGKVGILLKHDSDSSELEYLKERYGADVIDSNEGWFLESFPNHKKQFKKNFRAAKEFAARLESKGYDTIIVDNASILADLNEMSDINFFSIIEVI